MTSGVTMTVDSMPALLAGMAELRRRDVLVGIPDEKTERAPEPGGRAAGPTNATIGYAMEFGMPEHNVPARAFLMPGVQNAAPQITRGFYRAADAVLKANGAGTTDALNAIGLVASASVKRKITQGPFEPLKPATIAARHRGRGSKNKRKAEIEYAQLLGYGVEAGEAQDLANIHPLINTGQLRASVTYAVRERSR